MVWKAMRVGAALKAVSMVAGASVLRPYLLLIASMAAMDELNHKYGLSALAPATMLTAFKAAPTRIVFHNIPDLF